MTLSNDGWARYSIWEHSQHVRDLYAARAADEAEEMTCAAQAAELLRPLVAPGDSVLDVGCGSGWFYHSLRRRGIDVEYWGVDASATFIEIGRAALERFDLSREHLQVVRLEDLTGAFDHVICMNVLSNIDGYHRPLERMLQMARKSVVLRESLGEGTVHTWVRDEYLDPGVDLRVHVNRYDLEEVVEFVQSYGFTATHVVDRRTDGEPELVIGHPHHWAFVVATR